jgi:outer membrane protein OmpA-like peptidoglycan-associated protein
MKRLLVALIVCGMTSLLLSACATKKYVREQIGSTESKLSETESKLSQTESKLSQRVDTQETKLRETSDRTAALDTRVGEAAGMAADAKRDAAAVASAQRESETSFNQRFANRNKFSVIDTKVVYFDFNKTDLRDETINELSEIAKALKADPNAVLELQGFADPRGSDHYNYQLTRERVDAVVRYLVDTQGIDLRRLYGVGMGKVAPVPGEKQTRETLAKSRKVELRLVGPQS